LPGTGSWLWASSTNINSLKLLTSRKQKEKMMSHLNSVELPIVDMTSLLK
jgi:hypothetical protein